MREYSVWKKLLRGGRVGIAVTLRAKPFGYEYLSKVKGKTVGDAGVRWLASCI